jgi:hypothetical protein
LSLSPETRLSFFPETRLQLSPESAQHVGVGEPTGNKPALTTAELLVEVQSRARLLQIFSSCHAALAEGEWYRMRSGLEALALVDVAELLQLCTVELSVGEFRKVLQGVGWTASDAVRNDHFAEVMVAVARGVAAGRWRCGLPQAAGDLSAVLVAFDAAVSPAQLAAAADARGDGLAQSSSNASTVEAATGIDASARAPHGGEAAPVKKKKAKSSCCARPMGSQGSGPPRTSTDEVLSPTRL